MASGSTYQLMNFRGKNTTKSEIFSPPTHADSFFCRAYATTFRMSDGSSIVDSDVKDMEHMDAAFLYMKTLMTSVGATRVSLK
jgi:hypothetical protein